MVGQSPTIHFAFFNEDVDVFADLRVERSEGEKEPKRALVIEIKMFVTGSAIHNLEVAVGQYTTYRSLLKVVAPDHEFYLATGRLHITIFLSHYIERSVLR